MNNIERQYKELLEHIIRFGVKKKGRNGETLSVFGQQIRHNMSEKFPLLTTKKMYWKGIVTELLWFLRGETNIRILVDNDCHIWDGDAFKNYYDKSHEFKGKWPDTQKEFIDRIKTDIEFAKKWGDLGPTYGKQWRSWDVPKILTIEKGKIENGIGTEWGSWERNPIDQIANLIHTLKTNPDDRRMIVSSWNVGELDEMVLPPCHLMFQFYTRELSLDERKKIFEDRGYVCDVWPFSGDWNGEYDGFGIPRRAISIIWIQRSVDTFLGLPFNIASYALLLEIIGKLVNMVPEEVIGNLGDTHLYVEHIDAAQEQLTRKPFELPQLSFDGEWLKMINENWYGHDFNRFINQTKITDFVIENYQCHPTIKAELKN